MGKSVSNIGRAAAGVATLGGSELLYYGPQDQAKKAAEAAQGASMAQQTEAQRQYNYTQGILNRSEEQLNQATVSGLTALDRDIANQERNLSRQEQLIGQLDPTIIEASQQALKLLRGEQSSTLNPLQNQRATQRQKLLASLREQLGPGAETSTAGIQALNRFDAETSTLFGNAQQQALSNLGGVSAQFTSQRPDMLREIAGLSGFGQQKYQLGANQANYGLQRVSAQQGAGAQLLGTAGAQYTGDLMKAQSQQALLGQLTNLGITAGTAAATGGLSFGAKAKPQAATV